MLIVCKYIFLYFVRPPCQKTRLLILFCYRSTRINPDSEHTAPTIDDDNDGTKKRAATGTDSPETTSIAGDAPKQPPLKKTKSSPTKANEA